MKKLLEETMKKTSKGWILFFIFLLVLFTRLYFVFQTSYFHNDGYLTKRYVENIIVNEEFISYDQLSYNGRDVLYSPLFHYILAFFGGFLGLDFALKLLPNIFISLLVVVVYKLSKELVDNENLALFIALVSGFIPIVFAKTLNNISVFSLILPVVFYLLYLLMKLDKGKNVNLYVFFSFFLALLHPAAILFLIGLIFYLILAVGENLKVNKLKKEAIFFSIFLILAIEFLVYKKAFLEYGWSVIYGNIPYQVLADYFKFNFLDVVYKVGVLPIIFGFTGVIFGFIKKKGNVFLLSGIIFSSLLLMWLRLIDFVIALMFSGISLLIVSVISLNALFIYFDKTKMDRYKIAFYFIIMVLFIFSLVMPSFIDANKDLKEIPDEYEILVLGWIKENSLPDVTILAPLEKGHLISSVADRMNVIDSSFLLAPDTEERFRDVERIFSTKSEVEALDLLHKYNVDYILMPVEIEIKYGKVKWLNDKSNFEGIFFGNPKVYKVVY